MKNSKNIVSVSLLLALSILGVSAQAQRQVSRTTDRQAGVILQRIEQGSSRFRNSLNAALVRGRVDQTDSQNDINTFKADFENATSQFRDQLTRRRANTTDVQNLLQKASLVNSFMARHRLNARVQSDWSSLRTDLNSLATAYGVSWQWDLATFPIGNPSRPSRLTDSELNQLIQRIDTGGDTFRSSLTEAFGQTRYDRTTRESNMNQAVRAFKSATEQLRNQFDNRQPVGEHVDRVIALATPIDTYMRNNPVTNKAQNDWTIVRGDVNRLAGAYNIASSQNSDEPPVRYNSDGRLTGTFRLDASRSDNPRTVAERVTRTLSNNQRQGISDRVLARLESPEMLAIERRGSTISLASSQSRQSTFEADGAEQQEQLSNGRSSRVTATLSADQLSVNSTGYRENDYKVTFQSIENGSGLRVTREIYSERLTQPIVVNSIYNRTSEVAQWNIYDGSAPGAGNTGANRSEFLVRDGETVMAVLNNNLTSNETKQGDRFTMTVREPGQYEGAVIDGTVARVDQGGRLSGRSGLSLNFDTIRLRNGQTHSFAGILASVRTPNGDTIKVDNEGGAQGNDQTTQTIKRGGIGTAIGAVIGAIAGGAKGAVIGAVVGAAGGAGSVYVQGKDNFELPSGTEMTIRASGPR